MKDTDQGRSRSGDGASIFALDRVEPRVLELCRMIEYELATGGEDSLVSRQTRMDDAPNRYLADVDAARRECAEAGMAYEAYTPLMNNAALLLNELCRFSTFPAPPVIDAGAVGTDPVILTAGYYHKANLNEGAWRNYQELKQAAATICDALRTIRIHVASDRRVALRSEGIAVEHTTSQPREDHPPGPWLRIDLDTETLTINGKSYSVTSKNALRWIRVLIDNEGKFIAGKDLKSYDDELIDAQTSKLRKHLPRQVNNLIEAKSGKGSRIRKPSPKSPEVR